MGLFFTLFFMKKHLHTSMRHGKYACVKLKYASSVYNIYYN
jgi:hypothetical protein